MEIRRWPKSRGDGVTIRVSKEEAEEIIGVMAKALINGKASSGGNFDVEIVEEKGEQK